MKKAILIVVLIAGAAAAGLAIYRNLHPVRADRMIVSGNIELTQVDIAFKTAGRLLDRAVDEGDPVKKGMVIAHLDRDQLERQRDREQAALESYVAQLAESEAGLKWQQQSVAADLEVRRADISQASTHLLALKNGSRPQEIQEAQAAVANAQAEFDRAKKDWDRAQTLFKDDDISRAQYDQYRARFDGAEAGLKQANEHAALVVAGPRSEDIEGADAQVVRAKAALKLGEANEVQIEQRQHEIAARKADIVREKAQIALIDAQLADTVASSPVDGVVLVKSADPGEVLAPGTAVVTIGDIEHPWLRAYVNETDLGRVKLGGKVKVTTDSFPGKVYDGRISFISSEAEFTPKQIQTSEERIKLVYRIKIDIANPQHELKSNMPADAEILLGN